MPWHIERNHGDCPFAVILDRDGSVAGCHDTHKEALAQVAALYASEREKAALSPPDTAPSPTLSDEEFERRIAVDGGIRPTDQLTPEQARRLTPQMMSPELRQERASHFSDELGIVPVTRDSLSPRALKRLEAIEAEEARRASAAKR